MFYSIWIVVVPVSLFADMPNIDLIFSDDFYEGAVPCRDTGAEGYKELTKKNPTSKKFAVPDGIKNKKYSGSVEILHTSTIEQNGQKIIELQINYVEKDTEAVSENSNEKDTGDLSDTSEVQWLLHSNVGLDKVPCEATEFAKFSRKVLKQLPSENKNDIWEYH